MKKNLTMLLLVVILSVGSVANATSKYFPSNGWETVSSEEAGFDVEKFAKALQYANTLDSIGGIV